MTREQAASVLKHNRDRNPNATKFNEACNLAIKALEAVEALQNRCYAVTGYGSMCRYCILECDNRRKMV